MKIIVSSDYFPPYIGGAEHHVRLLADKLLEMGHEVVVITRKLRPSLTPSYDSRKLEMPSALHIFKTIFQGMNPVSVDPLLTFGLSRYEKLLKTADIIHCHGVDTLSFCLLRRRIKSQLVCTVHDFWPICVRRDLISSKNMIELPHNCRLCVYKRDSFLLTNLGQSSLWSHTLGNIADLLRRCDVGLLHDRIDHFVAVSEFVKRCLIKEGFRASKIDVVYNWVDVDAIRKNVGPVNSIQQDDRFCMIFIGNLHLNKGLHILIRALALLKKQFSDFLLIVVGEGRHMSYFQKLARMLGVDNYVQFRGRVPEMLLKKFLINSSALIVPSIWPEPCPTVILEAMALGVPVIASNIGGIPELVSNSETGLLFRPGDPSDLCDKIVNLLSDKDRLLSMREKSVRRAKERFDIQSGLGKLLNIYEKLKN